jgi:DNA-binding MarR family transcriptional regulator
MGPRLDSIGDARQTGVVREQGHIIAEGEWGQLHPRTLYLIKQVQYKTYVRLEDALQPLGITSAQFRIMTTLSLQSKRSSAELSRMYGVKPQTMIKQIAMLEDRALVVRSVSPSNKRVLEVTLTEKGKRILARATARAVALEEEIFASFTWEEVGQYRGLMMRLLESLKQTEHEAEEYELVPGNLK